MALAEYHDDIFGQESIPLVDTEVPGLVANRFASRPDERQVYSLYNSTSAPVSGPLLRIPGHDLTRVSLLFGEGVECRAAAVNGGTTIEGTINARRRHHDLRGESVTVSWKPHIGDSFLHD